MRSFFDRFELIFSRFRVVLLFCGIFVMFWFDLKIFASNYHDSYIYPPFIELLVREWRFWFFIMFFPLRSIWSGEILYWKWFIMLLTVSFRHFPLICLQHCHFLYVWLNIMYVLWNVDWFHKKIKCQAKQHELTYCCFVNSCLMWCNVCVYLNI